MDSSGNRALASSLEKEHTRRLEFLEGLRRRYEKNRQDKELEGLCGDMDRLEHQKVYLESMLGKLQRTRGALESATTRETELFVPQSYDATFDRALFRRTLGLDIRLSEDRLISLVFSQIDPQQCDRQFRVVLDISETGDWEVVNLDPHVHGVEGLMQTLNTKDGGITAFCKAFRKQCKKHIAQCHDN